jgi:DNA-binding NarL/FixJ family response regulator
MAGADSQRRVRVLVADDQRLMRAGIVSLLELQATIEIVGSAANGQEAVELALNLKPDVVLMDVRMPGMDGVQATMRIRQQLPNCQILMLTTFDDEEYVIEALRAGACGYLLKDIPAQDLARAIQAAHNGIYQLDPSVAAKVIGALGTKKESQPAMIELTERERAVLRLIAQGATNREIADRLVISEGTVKNHISNILSRLGLRDRTQAAIYARENGLL